MSDRRPWRPEIEWLASNRRRAMVAAAMLLLAPLLWAQEAIKGQRQEGELQAFINQEAKDHDAKLEVLQQTLYEVDQKLTNLTFTQRYGDRIRMERVKFPDPDHDLTPGYIFTLLPLEKGKRYPGLVAVHDGYHFSLIFGRNDAKKIELETPLYDALYAWCRGQAADVGTGE